MQHLFLYIMIDINKKLVLDNIAHTLSDLGDVILEIQKKLQATDKGRIVGVGYSGRGKSSTFSSLLLHNLNQHYSGDTNQEKVIKHTFILYYVLN